MYFTDTPELRRFEREMKQKPNFDRWRDKKAESEDLPNDKADLTSSKSSKKKGG